MVRLLWDGVIVENDISKMPRVQDSDKGLGKGEVKMLIIRPVQEGGVREKDDMWQGLGSEIWHST